MLYAKLTKYLYMRVNKTRIFVENVGSMKHKFFAIALFRYMVFALFVLMVAHCGLLANGIDLHISEVVLVTGGFVLVHVLSRVLGFCAWHRVFIYYDYAVIACMWWRRLVGWGSYLHCARLTMFVSGIVLLALFGAHSVKKALRAKRDDD